MASVIYFNFELKMNKFMTILKKIQFFSIHHGFILLKTTSNHKKLHEILKENLKSMKDQFVFNLKKKEQDIQLTKKTLKHHEETYAALKSREVEIIKALNSKCKIINTLEQRKKSLPLVNINENSAKKNKFFEEKVHLKII